MKKVVSEIARVVQDEGFKNAPRKGFFFRREQDHYKIVSVYKDQYSDGYWVDFLIAIEVIEPVDLSRKPVAQISVRAGRISGVDRYAVEAFCGTSPNPTEEDLLLGESEFRKALRKFASMYRSIREICEDFRDTGLRGWLIVHKDQIRLKELSEQLLGS